MYLRVSLHMQSDKKYKHMFTVFTKKSLASFFYEHLDYPFDYGLFWIRAALLQCLFLYMKSLLLLLPPSSLMGCMAGA